MLTATASFEPSIYFPPAIFKATSGFSAHRAALMTKTDLIFQAFSIRLVDFAVKFCFPSKFSFYEK